MGMLTAYHSAFYACDLTKRNASDDIAKLGPSLFSATVDLNPHQLDAALFAFRSPLSRGAILADEVGLGKTIEAGLIIMQLWAERKRRILVIAPTILRKQWAQEMSDKFALPSTIIDTREYNSRARGGYARPLEVDDGIVICSPNFARAKEREIHAIAWDLVVIDEAHRLRNVYKPNNKIAKAIKAAVSHRPLVMLTATPLQNSLLELFGLVSFLDEHLFGDIEAFRARYMRGPIEQRQLSELRHRLRPVCHRTLRRQVQEYVRFTNRLPITQDFTPSADEQRLYDGITDYLRRDSLNALPSSQRKLMTLVLRKLLASSSYAIAATLASLVQRLGERTGDLSEAFSDFETLDELIDEWPTPTDDDTGKGPEAGSTEDIRNEIRELADYGKLAASITVNAKGEALVLALQQGFSKMQSLGANRKAVIFTESRRTQAYLVELLKANGYDGRILTINGTNADDRSGGIYRAWVAQHRGEAMVTGNKTVDLRAALVDHFRDHADILVATEAAAEGINLQFCSLVVNYDLPWNPQRIEQRIGRCHRYGQKHDVVVINFINRSNEADVRVFQLLSEKFQLFEGVFGASDEVLGALESGVDFESRINEIYQTCRSGAQIDGAFRQLQLDLEEQIATRMDDTRAKLLENFDEEVHDRLRVSRDESNRFLGRIQRAFWGLTKFELGESATFDDARCRFQLGALPEGWPEAPPGEYQLVTPSHRPERCRPYRFGDALAQHAIERAKQRDLPPARLTFDLAAHSAKVGILEPLVGKSGWLAVSLLTVSSLEEEDRLLIAVMDEEGNELHPDVGLRLFDLPGCVEGECEVPIAVSDALTLQTGKMQQEALDQISQRNMRFFDDEIEKLDRWADDLKHGLQVELKDLEAAIKQRKKDARFVPDLQSKVAAQREVAELESKRNRLRRELFDAEDTIDRQKEEVITSVEGRLNQSVSARKVLSAFWTLR